MRLSLIYLLMCLFLLQAHSAEPKGGEKKKKKAYHPGRIGLGNTTKEAFYTHGVHMNDFKRFNQHMKHSSLPVIVYLFHMEELETESVTKGIHNHIIMQAIPRIHNWAHVHIIDCGFPKTREMDKHVFYSKGCSKFQNAKKDPVIVGFKV